MSSINKMRNFIAFTLILISIKGISQERFNYSRDFQKILAKTKDPNDQLNYEKQLKRFVSFDTTLTEREILALLIGFTAKPEYNPYKDIEKESAIFKLNSDGKYQEALNEATEFLKTHPLSLKTIFEKEYSFRKLNSDSAEDYNYLGISILVAMHYSGDGKSKETAMFALGTSDGQIYIHRLVKGKIGAMLSGRDSHGNFLDILESIRNGNSITFYFNIQHAAKLLRADFEKNYDDINKQN